MATTPESLLPPAAAGPAANGTCRMRRRAGPQQEGGRNVLCMCGDQLRHTGRRDVFTQQRGGRSFYVSP
jgi:hypothetical protein